MPGKHAKTLTKQQLAAALRRAVHSRYPDRDRVMVLLSVKAGLRAGEIAKPTWPMLVDAQGRPASHIELHDAAAKKRSGRTIPLHPDLIRPLQRLQKEHGARGPVIRSERGEALCPSSVVNWFARLYRELGFKSCSSHSGRRTFITNAARLVFKAGGSLRDIQQLAGHRSIEHTQAYM
jgi:integrase